MIPNVVIHVNNEQPLLADLFGLPTAADACLICTNLRTLNGKRPVFADRTESIFLFPLIHIRFVELPPDALESGSALLPPTAARAARAGDGDTDGQAAPAEPEAELEIDEDFLRRIREV